MVREPGSRGGNQAPVLRSPPFSRRAKPRPGAS
jgi:hypothetical protein